jgi:carbamoyl-phosphate synthase large subunit
MFKNKRIFISGGSGVIGNYLVEKLSAEGAILYVGDLKPRPAHWNKNTLYRQGDLNYITREELEYFSPEYFFHLAATFERSDESYEFWEENRRHNLNLSTYLMGILKDIPSLKKVIFASSYLIYDKQLYNFEHPVNQAKKLKETDPILPRNLTGSAKLNHEIELRFLNTFKKDHFQTVSARIYRSYGKYSRDIISRWVRALLNNEEITVYKKEGIFDYIYAEDVADGLIKLAETPDANGIVNLGRGNARKVSEVLEVLKSHFPLMKYKEADIEMLYEASEADMTLFRKITSWQPTQDIETVIPKLIEFEKQVIAQPKSDCRTFNILITSISKKIPLIKAVREAANKIGSDIIIIGGDGNEDCIGKYFVDSFWHMPRTSDENKKTIVQYLIDHNIKAIIPTRDGELMFWAGLKEELYEIGIMVSAQRSVENCLDKFKFYEVLKDAFPVIVTSLSLEEKTSVSFVVKERLGAGSANIGINLNKEEALAHSKKMTDPIFQPYIKGIEYSVDIYLPKNGKAKGCVVRSRDLVINGESQITTTVLKPDLSKLSVALAERLDLYGHVVLQIIERDEEYFIIECNSRFGGASTLSLSAGLDSFYWFLLEAMGEEITQYPFLESKGIKKQIRFSEDIVVG